MGSNPISSIATPGRCFVIAEAGTSHSGDIQHAFRLIDAARESGADCVKFQAVIADEILHPLTGSVDLPTGGIALYERFRMLERDRDFYASLKEQSERRGLVFLCTPFGLRSAAMLESLGVVAYKIASPELNHFPLLRAVAATGKPLFLSTGVSTLADIERALDIAADQAVLLHCITAYPAPEEEYNLTLIPNLRALLGVPVGLSDHSLDPVLVPALATALGACCIEKHLTLSRSSSGLDDPVALEPGAFLAMVQAVRLAEEEGPERTRERLSRRYTADRVDVVRGSGLKRLAPAERANYGRTNRSIHALGDIRRGEILGAHNLTIVRTEKVLRPGVGPELYEHLVGRAAAKDIPAGQGVRWEDF
jgi:sialic acid synthase SpsE